MQPPLPSRGEVAAIHLLPRGEKVLDIRLRPLQREKKVVLPRNSSASGSRLGGFPFECNG